MTQNQTVDGIELLIADHRQVDQLYAEFQAASRSDTQRRNELRNEIVRQLSMHAVVEEEYLYPLTAEAFPGGEGLSEHSVEDHQTIKNLLHEVEGMKPGDARLDDTLAAVIAEVTEHVAEEEGELFPKLRTAVGQERIDELGQQLRTAKLVAPTRPHPRAPNRPPFNQLLAPGTAVLDRLRDLVRAFPSGRR